MCILFMCFIHENVLLFILRSDYCLMLLQSCVHWLDFICMYFQSNLEPDLDLWKLLSRKTLFIQKYFFNCNFF